MYKIVTLGETFVFLTPKESSRGLRAGDGAHFVKLFLDKDVEYSIDVNGKNDIFAPDLYRALLTYIYKVKGLPKSDYEIKLLPSGEKVVLENNDCKIGGNVGKCKLKLLNINNESFSLKACEVSIEKEKCVVIHCDNVHNFDEKALCSAVYRCGLVKSCHVFAPVSFSSAEIMGRIITLPAFEHQSASVSLAAMHACFSNVFGVTSSVISLGESKAFCENGARGVCVYDSAPEAYMIFE